MPQVIVFYSLVHKKSRYNDTINIYIYISISILINETKGKNVNQYFVIFTLEWSIADVKQNTSAYGKLPHTA